jgi:hypothetical protein
MKRMLGLAIAVTATTDKTTAKRERREDLMFLAG